MGAERAEVSCSRCSLLCLALCTLCSAFRVLSTPSPPPFFICLFSSIWHLCLYPSHLLPVSPCVCVFTGVDFAELHKTAAQMKEKDETFPRFESGELDIFQRPQLYCPQPQEASWERNSYQQSAPTAASSPNEEWPPSSQTQSEATGEEGERGIR